MALHSELISYLSDIFDETLAFEHFYNPEMNYQMCYVKFKSTKNFGQLYNLLDETDYEIMSLKKYKNFWIVIMGFEMWFGDYKPENKLKKLFNKIKSKFNKKENKLEIMEDEIYGKEKI